MDLFTYLIAKKGHNTHRDLFSYLLGKKGSGTYTTFSGTSLNISNTLRAKIKNIALKGNTSQDGTPTPDTPIPIKVVTGNVEVKINNKNLFNYAKYITQFNETTTSVYGIYRWLKLGNFKPNTKYVISGYGTGSKSGTTTVIYDKLHGTVITYLRIAEKWSPENPPRKRTITTTNTGELWLVVTNGGTVTGTEEQRFLQNMENFEYCQIEEGETKTDFEPHQEQNYPITMGSLEAYDTDELMQTSGKNLFNKDTITEGKYIDNSGNLANDSSNFTGDYIEIDITKPYYANQNAGGVIRVGYYDSSKTFISRQLISANYGSLTIPENTKYVRLSCYNTSLNTLMLNEGTTPLPYEPYGTNEWYLKSNWGKVVLDGSEEWTIQNYNTEYSIAKNLFVNNNISSGSTNLLSNYFTIVSSVVGAKIGQFRVGTAYLNFNYDDGVGGINNFKTWLSTHNNEVVYPLITPAFTKITDTTLISQLENLNNNAKSYDGQTNITQTNDNLPFNISVDVKVTSVGNLLNTSLLSSNLQEETNIDDIQEEPNLDNVNEIEDIEQNEEQIEETTEEEPIENEKPIEEETIEEVANL